MISAKIVAELPLSASEGYVNSLRRAYNWAGNLVEKSLDEIETEIEFSEQVNKIILMNKGSKVSPVDEYKIVYDYKYLNQLKNEALEWYIKKVRITENISKKEDDFYKKHVLNWEILNHLIEKKNTAGKMRCDNITIYEIRRVRKGLVKHIIMIEEKK